MHLKQFKFKVGSEIIAAHTISSSASEKPHFLFMHGAGKATKERMKFLAHRLAEVGISSLGFDFSGHGESTGNLKESSLKKRTKEAQSALKFLSNERDITICASSMGAHIALELLKTNPTIKSLILFCPAIYHRDAFDVYFNECFSEIIRKSESWKRADVLDVLDDFNGNLLIYFGEKDEVIPRGVIELLDLKSKKTTKKEIVKLPGVDHQIAKWLSENNNEAMISVMEKITAFSA